MTILVDELASDHLAAKERLEAARRALSEARCVEHVLVMKTNPEVLGDEENGTWNEWGVAYCAVCGEDLGWYCPDSRDGVCHYQIDEWCNYCGHPEERK